MNIKKYNISKPEKITAKDGTEKTIWHNVGTLTRFMKDDGKVNETLEIPAIGLKANIFEIVDKAQAQPRPFQQPTEPGEVKYPTEEINPEDIPF